MMQKEVGTNHEQITQIPSQQKKFELIKELSSMGLVPPSVAQSVESVSQSVPQWMSQSVESVPRSVEAVPQSVDHSVVQLTQALEPEPINAESR
ncbi:hypothetical protein PInf_015163 [Phytophthora infestans]|nr:hypothetical protein PInf_015163 [Phytophthora infestans]